MAPLTSRSGTPARESSNPYPAERVIRPSSNLSSTNIPVMDNCGPSTDTSSSSQQFFAPIVHRLAETLKLNSTPLAPVFSSVGAEQANLSMGEGILLVTLDAIATQLLNITNRLDLIEARYILQPVQPVLQQLNPPDLSPLVAEVRILASCVTQL